MAYDIGKKPRNYLFSFTCNTSGDVTRVHVYSLFGVDTEFSLLIHGLYKQNIILITYIYIKHFKTHFCVKRILFLKTVNAIQLIK